MDYEEEIRIKKDLRLLDQEQLEQMGVEELQGYRRLLLEQAEKVEAVVRSKEKHKASLDGLFKS
ncbi:DUF1192 family protein [Kiloniella sp. b19]|uniref:DUF1192 family protein n=1 Tax=Kiloniella sp. GXU_MW_B19 TaxID=3141326 RepID=UPI0031E08247